VKKIDWGSFKRTKPIDRNYGFARGTPIDRYYIEGFLGAESDNIHGIVLEFLDSKYTKRFGGDRVRLSEVMCTANDKPRQRAIVGDLQKFGCLKLNRYNCIIATQVLQYMKRPKKALENLAAALKPGGVLLGTWAVATRTYGFERKRWPLMTTVTAAWLTWALESCRYSEVAVEEHGNVLALTSFLWGLAVEDLNPTSLGLKDPDYPMILTFKAIKA
jgi:SAM-dependent methyltransferase